MPPNPEPNTLNPNFPRKPRVLGPNPKAQSLQPKALKSRVRTVKPQNTKLRIKSNQPESVNPTEHYCRD